MDQQILRDGTWEPDVTAAIAAELPKDGVFWDVGANGGIHALTIKHARPDVRVIAFEPSPSTFTRLRVNARANQLEIEPYCVAVSDRRGYQQLSVVDAGNSGHDSLRPWEGVAYSGSFLCWFDTVVDLIAAD
jgi:FkbM family methyltransferase